MTGRRSFCGILLAVAGCRSAEAFVVGGQPRLSARSGVFAGTPMASVAAPAGGRPIGESRHLVSASRRGKARKGGAGGARMMVGQDFATCSEDDFRAYIIGWTFVWSGIIPYTFIAARNLFGAVLGSKPLPVVSEGEDATVSNQTVLLYKEPIKLLDIINIVGRFQTFDEVQAKTMASGVMSDYLFRDTFKESLRSRKFKGWPKGPDGQPALKDKFGGDVKAATRSLAKRELSDTAMNAVFDSFVGSPLSIVADRFKVDNQLENWRKDNTFDVKGFEQGLLIGRLLFLFTIVSVIGLEVAGYSVFFVEPIIIRYGNPLSALGL